MSSEIDSLRKKSEYHISVNRYLNILALPSFKTSFASFTILLLKIFINKNFNKKVPTHFPMVGHCLVYLIIQETNVNE